MEWNKKILTGTHGEVLLSWLVPENPIGLTVLYHGVHSAALPHPANKYAKLCIKLASKGQVALMINTSRRAIERPSDPKAFIPWVITAFGNKTFADEIEDCRRGTEFAVQEFANLPLTLWGYSLGGFSSLILSGEFKTKRLVICGTGHSIRQGQEEALKLPILNSLPPSSDLPSVAAQSKTEQFDAFYGSKDLTFEEKSCRDLYDLVPAPIKSFTLCDGADHSLKTVHGEPTDQWLDLAVAQVIR